MRATIAGDTVHLRILIWLGVSLREVRYAARHLVAHRGIAIAAVLSLGIGIAACATTFSWVDQMLLRPLPGVRDAREVFVLLSRSRAGVAGNLSAPDYQDLRAGITSIAAAAATGFSPLTFSTTASEPAERVSAEFVSDNYFETLGARVALGRAFQQDEATVPGAGPVVVLSDALWRRRFAGSSSVPGKTVLLNKQSFTIIGVMNPEFHGGFVATDTDVWMPLAMQRQLLPGDLLVARGTRWLQGLIRLPSGVSPGQLQARVGAVSQRLAKDYASTEQGRTFFVTPLWRSPAGAQAVLRPVLFALAGLAALLLVLACANVANLLLARALQRRRELAIRLALGSSMGRAVAPFLAEALLLAMAGGLLGLILTYWSVGLLRLFQPPAAFTVRFDVHVDSVGLQFLAVVVLVAAGILGLIPALYTKRAPVVAVLRAESESLTDGPSRRRLSDLLAIVQIATCLAVLIGTGLSLRSFNRAQRIPLGFNPDNVLLVSYDLSSERYTDDAGIGVHQRRLEQVRAVPGVHSASLASTVPFGLTGQPVVSVHVDGYVPHPGEDMQAGWNVVSSLHFRTLGIPIISGREFDDRDRKESSNVAILSDNMARRYWPNGDALGRRIRCRDQMLEVVGVVADVRYDRLKTDPPLLLYVPALQWYRPSTTLHIRTAASAGMLSEIRRAFTEVQPAIPSDTTTLSNHIEASTFMQRFAASLSLALVIPCLVLTAVGIFSLLAYAIAARTAEISLRVALGAQRADVVRMILRHAAVVTALGLGLGVLAGSMTAALLTSILVGVSGADAPTWIAGSLTVVSIATVASAIATLRATRIGPLIVFAKDTRT